MRERPRLHDVPVASGDLRVAEWPSDGPTTLLLHGLTANHVSWLFLADALPERRLLAPDLRGRGGSRALPGPYGLAAHADDVAAVIDRLGGGPVAVVGHSMGGFIAAALAERHPDLVEGLVLVDGGLPFATDELTQTEQVVAAIRAGLETRYPDLAAYQEAFRQHPAFTRDWSPHVEAFLAYDLVGEIGDLRRAADTAAVAADQVDIAGYGLDAALDGVAGASFLHADRGFLDDPPGLYAAPTVTAHAVRWPRIRGTHVPDVNHYTIAMSARGAGAIAEAVRRTDAG